MLINMLAKEVEDLYSMWSFCQKNSLKIHGNDGMYRIRTQNTVQK